MAIDRQWLRDQVASYLRDGAIADVDQFIDSAFAKVSVMLQSTENEEVTELGIASQPYVLPANLNAIRVVTYPYGSGDYNLHSVPVHRIGNYGSGGYPRVYAVKGNSLYIGPFVAGNYTLTWYRDVKLDEADNSQDDALTRYPFLFRNAVLSEAYAWKQDGEMATYYERLWMDDVRHVNRKSQELAQGDAPAMRAS